MTVKECLQDVFVIQDFLETHANYQERFFVTAMERPMLDCTDSHFQEVVLAKMGMTSHSVVIMLLNLLSQIHVYKMIMFVHKMDGNHPIKPVAKSVQQGSRRGLTMIQETEDVPI